ncbi:MAG: hypothetical protein ACYCSA_10150 [Thermoplasmataceae archaeon]|jgi:hypothetical protein
MNKKRAIPFIALTLVILVSSGLYEFLTLPHPTEVVPDQEASKLISKFTDSTNTTVNLSYLGSSESVLVGLDAANNVGSTLMTSSTIFSIKTFQNVDFPLSGLTYTVTNVFMNYSNSNRSLLPLSGTPIYKSYCIESQTQYYAYGIPGNYKVTYYVHVTAIAEIGILHLKGPTQVAALTFNINVTS